MVYQLRFAFLGYRLGNLLDIDAETVKQPAQTHGVSAELGGNRVDLSLPQIAMLGSTAAAAFAWQTRFRTKRGHWVLDYASTGLMLGFIVVGLVTLVLSRNLGVVVYLLWGNAWGYAPHAYNLVIWPSLALLVLRPRFGPAGFLLAFVFGYGLDELIWNSVAFIYFGGNAGYLGFTTAYWHAFLIAVILGVATSYYFLRPRIVPNWTWGFFAVYVFVYTVLAGLPTYIDAQFPEDPYVWAWELLWQAAVWVLIYGTLWPKSNSNVTLQWGRSSRKRADVSGPSKTEWASNPPCPFPTPQRQEPSCCSGRRWRIFASHTDRAPL